uniref:Gag-pol polyprotein n=1 Tax=Oryza sativa subsp. japonica TaxID=39947 RepID=Q8S622_ORYSJ|nr:putative gag-pol polyprotein [Oryza sativa Japonica Group]
MANKFTTKPHVFDGSDFAYWCDKMQSYIMAEDYDVWQKVALPYVIPEQIDTIALKTEFNNNCKARNILLSGISRLDFNRVSHLKTANEIWNALNNFHQMKPGEALDDYLGRFNKILSDLRFIDSTYDVNYTQSKVSHYFLSGLDMSIWEMKVTSIQESVDMSTLTLDSLYTKLKTYEMNILSRKVDPKSSALFEEEDLALAANKISRAINNVRYRKRGGSTHCFECGALDHIRSHCPNLWRGKKEDNGGEKTKDNKLKSTFKGKKTKENLKKMFDQVYAAFEPLSDVDGENENEDKGKNISGVCFMARGELDSECKTMRLARKQKNEREIAFAKSKWQKSGFPSRKPALVARKENVWIMDSGCSRHMTGDKNWFSSLKQASKTESIIFDDASISAVLYRFGQGFTQMEGLDFDGTFTPVARIEIYVDDIVFGCSTHALVVEFAETIRREFEMSMMGELSYFLGLQIKQTPQGQTYNLLGICVHVFKLLLVLHIVKRMSGDMPIRLYYGDAPIQICHSEVDLTVYAFHDTSLNAPEHMGLNDVLGWLYNMFGVEPVLDKFVINVVWPVRGQHGWQWRVVEVASTGSWRKFVSKADDSDNEEPDSPMRVDAAEENEAVVDQMEVENEEYIALVVEGEDTTLWDDETNIPDDWMTISMSCMKVNDGLNAHWRYDSKQVQVGQMFHDKCHLKVAVKRWAFDQKREFRVKVSNRTTYKVKCTQAGCPWRVHGYKPQHDTLWVDSRVEQHTCLLENTRLVHRNKTAAFVAQMVYSKVVRKTSLSLFTIMHDVEKEYGYEISYDKAWWAKQKALEMRFGTYEAQKFNPNFQTILRIKSLSRTSQGTQNDK